MNRGRGVIYRIRRECPTRRGRVCLESAPHYKRSREIVGTGGLVATRPLLFRPKRVHAGGEGEPRRPCQELIRRMALGVSAPDAAVWVGLDVVGWLTTQALELFNDLAVRSDVRDGTAHPPAPRCQPCFVTVH